MQRQRDKPDPLLRVLSREEVRAAADMPAAIRAMEQAFGQLSAGQALVPQRLSLGLDGGDVLLMPAYLQGSEQLGCKIVSVFGQNPTQGLPRVSALVVMLNATTGIPRAVVEATFLTALRTGAATGLATKLLAKRDASVVAVYGAGTQARSQLEAVQCVRDIREVRIVSRTRQSAEAFAAEIEGPRVLIVQDRAAALKGADIVVTATSSRVPVFDGDEVEPGTHVNGVGSYRPDMREVDSSFVVRARIFVDSRTAALREAGDLIVPIKEGVISEADIEAELGEVVNGDKEGRVSEQDITFFKSVGTAAQDVVVADLVLAVAEEKEIGIQISLWD